MNDLPDRPAAVNGIAWALYCHDSRVWWSGEVGSQLLTGARIFPTWAAAAGSRRNRGLTDYAIVSVFLCAGDATREKIQNREPVEDEPRPGTERFGRYVTRPVDGKEF